VVENGMQKFKNMFSVLNPEVEETVALDHACVLVIPETEGSEI